MLRRSPLRTIASEIPIQYASVVAFSDDPDPQGYIDECRRMHEIRTHYIWRGLAKHGVACAKPEGAFYLFPSFDRWREPLAARGIHTSTDLAVHLLQEYQLAMLPGSAFGVPPEGLSLRLASSYLDMETDEKADAILAAFRADPDPDAFMRNHHPATQAAVQRFGQFVDLLG